MNEGSFWPNQIENLKQNAERARKQAEVEMADCMRAIIEEESETDMSDTDSDEIVWYPVTENEDEILAQEADGARRLARRKARPEAEAEAGSGAAAAMQSTNEVIDDDNVEIDEEMKEMMNVEEGNHDQGQITLAFRAAKPPTDVQ